MIIPEDLMIHKANEALLEKMNNCEIDEKIILEKNSNFHTIQIVDSPIGRFLKYDETYQAGFIKTKNYCGNLPYINYFLIPFLMNPDIKNILLVGFGSGILVNQFEKVFKNLKKIDIVDIEENILQIATDYFNFNLSAKINFYLQDALIYLKESKQKYDLIIVDVAGDEGIDKRFCNSEYLKLIKTNLKKDGIFVSNMPSSRDIFNKRNSFIQNLIKDYKNNFKNIDLYNGETSNKIFYKTFFDIDEIVLDITNLIFISSDKKYNISNNASILKNKLKIDIDNYLLDIIHT